MAGHETRSFLSSYLAGDWQFYPPLILVSLILETYSPPTSGSVEPVLGSPVYFLGSALLKGLRYPHRQLPPAQHTQLCLERGLRRNSAHPSLQEGCTCTPAALRAFPKRGMVTGWAAQHDLKPCRLLHPTSQSPNHVFLQHIPLTPLSLCPAPRP